jgi:2-polyprenyl-3-methyl-5-hydroxy-6-metoxy-1,4-benzoquinol methylase
MCSKIEKVLDVPKGKRDPLLHVLDIGCGRGQDILKWKLARVRYMVASDFSD